MELNQISGEVILLPLVGILIALYISTTHSFEVQMLGSLPLALGFELTTSQLSVLVIFIAVLVWLLIVLIIFKHAKMHSTHPKTWAIVTLLIGLFGVALYFVFGRKKGGGPT